MMRVTRLVIVLALGLLVPLTSYAAADDIRRDALKGDTASQYEMGILYEFGFHLAEHETEALAWYSVAAERGNEPAARRRDLLGARLSTTQRDRAAQRRREITAGMPAAMPSAVAPVEPITPVVEATPVPAPAPSMEAAPTPLPEVVSPVEPKPTPPAPTAETPMPSPAAEPPPAEPAPKP